jgi:arsenite-transporting ATPase
MAPRTILYTGKGGVGKTSVAAATARRCAAAGMRTIVLSTDPAHSLSDSLETELGPEPTEVGPRLFGQEVQAQQEMERHWEAVQDWLGELLAQRGVDRISAEELTVPPGMDELFSLLQIKRHHEEAEYDAIVVDCAPTGETLRLLSFPDVLSWWMERLFPIQRKAMGVARPLLRTIVDIPLPGDEVYAAVERLFGQLERLHKMMIDPELTSIRLVFNPERMVVKEAQRTYLYLNLFQYPCDLAVCNRVLPEAVHDEYFAQWKETQARYVETAAEA